MTTAVDQSEGSGSRRRVALVVVDQAICSGTNFIGGVLVARLAGVDAFGGYMLAYTVWLVLLLVQRAVVLEPLIILHQRADARSTAVRNALAAEVALGVVLGVGTALVGVAFLATGSSSTGGPLVAIGLSLPFLFVQDAWRGLAFKQRRPELAVVNDGLFMVVQVTLLVVLMTAGARTGMVAVAAWGAGAAAGALLGLVQFRTLPSRQPVAGLRGGWTVGRWLLAEVSTGQAAEQVSLLYVASRVGTAEFGGLRAGIALMGPTSVLFHAGANYGLPEATRLVDADDQRGAVRLAWRLTLGVGAVVWTYAALVIAFAGWLLTTVYGEEFAEYAGLARIVALSVAVIAFAFGAQTVLKAARMARSLWIIRVVGTALGFALTVVLTGAFGVTGAALGNLALSITLTVGALVAFRRWERHGGGEAASNDLDLLLSVEPLETPRSSAPPLAVADDDLPTPAPPAVVASDSTRMS